MVPMNNEFLSLAVAQIGFERRIYAKTPIAKDTGITLLYPEYMAYVRTRAQAEPEIWLTRGLHQFR